MATEKTFGFIIATCLRESRHLNVLYRCLESLFKYHPNQKKVVIIDYSSKNELVNQVMSIYSDVIFERSTENIAADMLMKQFFKDKKYFDTAILLHDGMKIKKEMVVDKIEDVKYIWHFTNHRIYWSTITEPETDFNRLHNIVTHDDLLIYLINNNIRKEDFKNYCKYIYYQKDKWCGAFGGLCIIRHDFLLKLDQLTGIIDFEKEMSTNRLRRAAESIVGLACQYVTGRNMEDAYDGLFHDGYRGNNYQGNIISKISFDRK